MEKIMKKTCLTIAFLLLILPMSFRIGNAYIVPPIVIIENHSRNPIIPDQGESTEVSCYVHHSGGSSLSVRLYYRFNGNSFTQVSMTKTANSYVKYDSYRFYEYVKLLQAGNLNDIVDYYIIALGIAGGDETEVRSPKTGYYSYTVGDYSEISWSSPNDGSEITFGPIDDNLAFTFDWSYVNLDDAILQIGDQSFDILNGETKVKEVILDGAALDGSTVPATLKGYKGGSLVDSDSRYFSFRRLDYNLNWETPFDGNTIAFSQTGPARFNLTFTKGLDIDYVKLFFNNTDMGEVTSPGTIEFTFENFEGTIDATLRGYDSGDNELSSDTNTFVFRRLVVEVIWESPIINSSITFGTGIDPVIFNFTYSKGTDVDYVKLELNSMDMGIVSNPGTIAFVYNDSFHGLVTAILRGFNEFDSEISSDTRYFRFDKMIATRFETLQEDEINLGNKLYLILHDPNGDDSVSSYEESTTISLGLGCEITAGVTTGLEIGVEKEFSFFGLFEAGIEASTKLSLSKEASRGFDARFEITDNTFLSSSDSSTAVDYIGPGYGDRYWGELWKFKYVITTHYIEYYNGSEIYYDPHLWWGILRDAEAYISDANAPQNWKALNPVHQGYPEEEIEWIGGILVADGGGTYINTHEVTNTNTMSESITIGIESETKAKLSAGGVYVEGSLELSLDTRVYAEMSASNTIKTSYTIHDDEPTDSIVQKVGIDKNFGTYIFQTETNFCATSNPIEHNTIDYVPPKFGYPTIIYDTDQDFKGPTPNDNPLVTVKIEEEGEIQDVVLYFSIDNGTSWRSIPLSEYPGQPGVWHTNIPKQINKTKVLWYLKAWDEEGNTEEKFDITGSYFSYEVGILINPLESPTPGFTMWTVLFSIVIGVIIVLKKRRHQ